MTLSPEVGMALFGLGMLCVGAGTTLLWMSGRYGRGRRNHQVSRLDAARVQAVQQMASLESARETPLLQVPHPMMTVLDPHEPLAIARPEFATPERAHSTSPGHANVRNGVNEETGPIHASTDSLDEIAAQSETEGASGDESSVTSIPVRREHTRQVSALRESVTLPTIPEPRVVARRK